MSVIIFPPCVHKNERSHSPPVCTRTGYVMILLIYLISIHTTRWIRVEGIQIPINGVKRYVCSTIDIMRREIPCTYVHEKKEPSSSCSSFFNRHVPEHHPEIHLLSDDLAPKILLFLDVRVIIDNDRSSFLCLALVAMANHTLTSHTTRPMRSYSHMASRNLQSKKNQRYKKLTCIPTRYVSRTHHQINGTTLLWAYTSLPIKIIPENPLLFRASTHTYSIARPEQKLFNVKFMSL